MTRNTRKTNTGTKQATAPAQQCYSCDRPLTPHNKIKESDMSDQLFYDLIHDIVCDSCRKDIVYDLTIIRNVVVHNHYSLKDVAAGMDSEIGTYNVRNLAGGFVEYKFKPISVENLGKQIMSKYDIDMALPPHRMRSIVYMTYKFLELITELEIDELQKMKTQAIQKSKSDAEKSFYHVMADLMCERRHFMLTDKTKIVKDEDLR